MFADKMIEQIDELVRGIRGWTKADHTQYFPVASPQNDNALALFNGSLLSVIRVNGYNGQYFPSSFRKLHKKWVGFYQTLISDNSSSGLDVFWSYEYDPEGLKKTVSSYRTSTLDSAIARGIDIKDILDEESDLFGNISAKEDQYILVMTNLDSLGKSERSDALSDYKKKLSGTMRGQGAMAMRMGVDALEVLHEQHVNKIMHFMTQANDSSFGYSVSRLSCYDALWAMRHSLTPDTTGSSWKAKLSLNDTRFRSTEDVSLPVRGAQTGGKPTDWSFILPPPLFDQMMPNEVVDLGRYAVIGSRTYAPMHVSELANEPEPLEHMLGACHKRGIPVRIVYTLSSNSENANYWNRTFASIFSFWSASNKQINRADKAMQQYKLSNGAIIGYGISITTWADTDVRFDDQGNASYGVKKLQQRASDLETLLQQWGGQQVGTTFGCAIESVMSATPGYIGITNCPKAPQIELDVITQLPLMRPAVHWEPNDAIWFSTADGVLCPYQPMSSNQSSMIQVVLGGMGYGKSNYISENLFHLATTPRAKELPYIRGIDFGGSSSGVIDMVRSALPEGQKHLSMFESFSASGSMVKNMFDTPVGMRYPLPDHQAFITTWLMTLLESLIEPAGVSNLSAVITAAIERAYQLADPRFQNFEPSLYEPNFADEKVKSAIERAGLKIDEHTHYWEIVDGLVDCALDNADKGLMYAAKIAQRRAVPQFSTLIKALDQLQNQFSSMPTVGNINLVNAVVNGLMSAKSEFPVFAGVTNRDISESRICVFDMSQAFGRGSDKRSDWVRTIYFQVAYRLLTEDLLVHKDLTKEQIEIDQGRLGISDALKDYHIEYLRRQDSLLKLFWADEVHRLGSAYGALATVSSVAFEARKYRVGLLLGSQKAQHIPKDVLDLSTSVFIFGANQSTKLASELGELFSLEGDEVDAIASITQPTKEKGAEVFVIHRTRKGTQRMKLQFRIGASKAWAYATEPEERALRGLLYDNGPSTSWARTTLATHVRDVKQLIKTKQSDSTSGLSEEDALAIIAKELLATYKAVV